MVGRFPTRFSLVLIGAFAVMATLLVGVGLYGVLSTLVRQPTTEIGLFAAFGLTRLMTTMLVGVTGTDPLTFAAIGVDFFAIATFSSWLPARRAAALDPTIAFREG